MKPFLASPNETIEGVSQKLKLKMASVERDTNCPKRKEMPRRQKKRSPNKCARQLFYRCSHNQGVCQHKVPFFNQRSTRLSSCVIMPESKIIHRFFCIMLAQFRCIVLKPGRRHVSIHGYTVMEQPVARNSFQSLAAGIMLIEPQQSSDNSLCSHPLASKTNQSGITCHKLQKRQTLAPNSKTKFDPKNEAIFGFA